MVTTKRRRRRSGRWRRWIRVFTAVRRRAVRPSRLCTNMASGVPQLRWRLISQSGRPSTMLRMRVRPLSGHELRWRRWRPTPSCAGVVAAVGRDLAVHGDEPLGSVAVEHRRLGAPGMRIAVLQPAVGEEHAGLASACPSPRRWPGPNLPAFLPSASITCSPPNSGHGVVSRRRWRPRFPGSRARP